MTKMSEQTRAESFVAGARDSVSLLSDPQTSIRNPRLFTVALVILGLALVGSGLIVGGVADTSPQKGEFYQIQVTDSEYEEFIIESDTYQVDRSTAPISYAGPDLIVTGDGVTYDTDYPNSRYALNEFTKSVLDENSERIEDANANNIYVTVETVQTSQFTHTVAETGSGDVATPPEDVSLPFSVSGFGLLFLVLAVLAISIQLFGTQIFEMKQSGLSTLIVSSATNETWYLYGLLSAYAVPPVALVGAVGVYTGASLPMLFPALVLSLMGLTMAFAIGVFAETYNYITGGLTVGVLGLMLYSILPTIFIGTHPLAIVSPMTPLVSPFYGIQYTLQNVLLASVIPLLGTALIFYFTLPVYRNGWGILNGFSLQKRILSNRGETYRSHALLITMLIPVAFIIQIITIGGISMLPTSVGIIILLSVISLTEELIKSSPVIQSIGEITTKDVLIRGGISGLVFYIVETVVVILQVGGLVYFGGIIPSTEAATQSAMLPLWASLIFPFFLHTITAIVTIYGMKYSKKAYAITITCSIVIHTVYNAIVSGAVGI